MSITRRDSLEVFPPRLRSPSSASAEKAAEMFGWINGSNEKISEKVVMEGSIDLIMDLDEVFWLTEGLESVSKELTKRLGSKEVSIPIYIKSAICTADMIRDEKLFDTPHIEKIVCREFFRRNLMKNVSRMAKSYGFFTQFESEIFKNEESRNLYREAMRKFFYFTKYWELMNWNEKCPSSLEEVASLMLGEYERDEKIWSKDIRSEEVQRKQHWDGLIDILIERREKQAALEKAQDEELKRQRQMLQLNLKV